MIETERLLLIPVTLESLHAEAAHNWAAMARSIGAAAPEQWPPELYDDDAVAWSIETLDSGAAMTPWTGYYFTLKTKDAPVLIGAGGFNTPPDAAGRVEIGYSVLEAHRRKGYAHEAVEGLVARAFAAPGVSAVVAHTYPDLVASIGVLDKSGFRVAGAGGEPGTVRFERKR